MNTPADSDERGTFVSSQCRQPPLPLSPYSAVVWSLCVIDQWRGCGVTTPLTERFC